MPLVIIGTPNIARPPDVSSSVAGQQSDLHTTKVTMRSVNSGGVVTASLDLPFAPVTMDVGDIGLVWTQIERPYSTPLLAKKGYKLPSFTFDLILVTPGPRQGLTSCEDLVRQNMASGGDDIRIAYGPNIDKFNWKMTDLAISVQQREVGTNAISKAKAHVVLTRTSDLRAPRVAGMERILIDRTYTIGYKTGTSQDPTSQEIAQCLAIHVGQDTTVCYSNGATPKNPFGITGGGPKTTIPDPNGQVWINPFTGKP
jgi:hypothetical protein